MRISDWSSDVCSSDLPGQKGGPHSTPSCRHAPASAKQPQTLHRVRQRARVRPASSTQRAGRYPDLLLRCPVTMAKGRRRKCNRTEEHTSELQSLMRISNAVICLTKKITNKHRQKL